MQAVGLVSSCGCLPPGRPSRSSRKLLSAVVCGSKKQIQVLLAHTATIKHGMHMCLSGFCHARGRGRVLKQTRHDLRQRVGIFVWNQKSGFAMGQDFLHAFHVGVHAG